MTCDLAHALNSQTIIVAANLRNVQWQTMVEVKVKYEQWKGTTMAKI